MACPVPLNLVCDAVGSATSSVSGSVLSAIAGWVVGGATWLLDELGKVITSSTTVNVRASWFLSHYKVMVVIAAVVAVPMLIFTAMQAVFQQNAAVLLRATFVHLPLAGLLTAAAVQLVQLALETTDALCTAVTTGTGGQLNKTFKSIGTVLSHQSLPLPTFVMTIGALLIASGAFVLWLELLVRSAAIYAAVLFLPLALVSLVWPAISHWCRRLTETLVALVLSKFVVVAVLSLAVGAVSSGDGFSTVLAGGALLLLAAFTPFTLLRLIPLVEVGAAMQLEGARQRARAAFGRAPDSAVGFALRQAREHGAHRETTASPGTPGVPGTGLTAGLDIPGPSGGSGPSGSLGPFGAGGADGADGAVALGGLGDLAGFGAAGAGAAAGASLATAGAGLAAGGDGAADGEGGQLALGPLPRQWLPPGDLTVPPGTLPVWEGSPESVVAALESTRRPHRVEPDGYGGVIPGVASPLWGGTEPLSRFEPGPKDDWSAWGDDTEVHGFPSTPSTLSLQTTADPQSRGAPPFIDRSSVRASRPGSAPDVDGQLDVDRLEGGHHPDEGSIDGAGTFWRPDTDTGTYTDWHGE